MFPTPAQPVELRWTEIKKGQTALLAFEGGWPDRVSILGAKGSILWEYQWGHPEVHVYAINAVHWVDLQGRGEKDLLVGFNGRGIHAVDPSGKRRWQALTRGSVSAVAGIDARGGRPGLALYSDGGKIQVLDAGGRKVRQLPNEGHPVYLFAAAELDDRGTRQVLAVWPAFVESFDYVVSTDLEEKVFWKYPVDYYNMLYIGNRKYIDFIDIDGDGERVWVIATGRGEIAVVDRNGRLMASLATTGRRWTSWTAVSRAGKPGWIVLADARKVEAYGLQPSK